MIDIMNISRFIVCGFLFECLKKDKVWFDIVICYFDGKNNYYFLFIKDEWNRVRRVKFKGDVVFVWCCV